MKCNRLQCKLLHTSDECNTSSEIFTSK